jgi:uncharacterized protein
VRTLQQTILWRRLDAAGHDACGLWAEDEGWRLAGATLFALDQEPCCLSYEVACDTSWRTRSARISGWIGRAPVTLDIIHQPGNRWQLNGVEQPTVEGLVDVDLGFTPATNLIQFRRLALAVGQAADAPAVYLRFPELRLERLAQRYHRLTHNQYDYQAPSEGYAAPLQVSESGFVTYYPGLWGMETR